MADVEVFEVEEEVSFGGDEIDRMKAAGEGDQFIRKLIDPQIA